MSDSEKIKVFLSDPQVLFREGIHFVLSGEEDFEVTGETTSNEDAYGFIESNPPNVAILSMKSPTLSGAEATRRIRRNVSSVAVILTAEHPDEEELFAALKAGASAWLTKDADPDYVLDVIRVVAQGSNPIIDALLIPGLASRAVTEFEDMETLNQELGNLLARLSPRESEILKSIAAGNSLEQMSQKLNTTEEMLRRNLRMTLSKLVANEQAKAVIEAAQRTLPTIIAGTARLGKPAEYVTKEEFNEFKETLMRRLKAFIGELD